MDFKIYFFTYLKLIVLISYLVSSSFSHANANGAPPSSLVNKTSFTRNAFPPHFLFGTASSAYQYEGAAKKDGRGPSMWDAIVDKTPELIMDGTNGNVAEDFYHRYKEDIMLMKSFGLDAFRLSISWSRIVPLGKVSKGVNTKGIEFYNKVINELIFKGIKPFVTIYHWDIPRALQDEYGGFQSLRIMNDFVDFADICFKEFGDRVKHWGTINEPFMYSKMAYLGGFLVGDFAKDPYLVAHHLLLSHARTVQLYRKKYKTLQNGQIGIVLNSDWMLPHSNSKVDIEACQRALDFMLGWFMEPLTHGEYPKIMQTIVGSRLPNFSVEEATMVKGSYDFLGLNYYTGSYVANAPSYSSVLSIITDCQVNQTFDKSGVLIGKPTGGPAFYMYPEGLHHLLVYIKKTYYNPLIYITENGMPDSNNATIKDLINDSQRVDFLHGHLLSIKEAIRDGVNVRGYFVWSLLDTWEWNSGYTLRFGLNFIDYKNGLKRIPKLSGKWMKSFLKG